MNFLSRQCILPFEVSYGRAVSKPYGLCGQKLRWSLQPNQSMGIRITRFLSYLQIAPVNSEPTPIEGKSGSKMLPGRAKRCHAENENGKPGISKNERTWVK
jgi:hypothetical protein